MLNIPTYQHLKDSVRKDPEKISLLQDAQSFPVSASELHLKSYRVVEEATFMLVEKISDRTFVVMKGQFIMLRSHCHQTPVRRH